MLEGERLAHGNRSQELAHGLLFFHAYEKAKCVPRAGRPGPRRMQGFPHCMGERGTPSLNCGMEARNRGCAASPRPREPAILSSRWAPSGIAGSQGRMSVRQGASHRMAGAFPALARRRGDAERVLRQRRPDGAAADSLP